MLLLKNNVVSVEENGTCSFKDEILADVLAGYLAGQGQVVINCDQLMKTDKYSTLSNEITIQHSKTIKDFSKAYKKRCNRYGITQKECAENFLESNFNVMKMIENQEVSKEMCSTLEQELRNRKQSWNVIFGQILAAYLGNTHTAMTSKTKADHSSALSGHSCYTKISTMHLAVLNVKP